MHFVLCIWRQGKVIEFIFLGHKIGELIVVFNSANLCFFNSLIVVKNFLIRISINNCIFYIQDDFLIFLVKLIASRLFQINNNSSVIWSIPESEVLNANPFRARNRLNEQ